MIKQILSSLALLLLLTIVVVITVLLFIAKKDIGGNVGEGSADASIPVLLGIVTSVQIKIFNLI